MINNINNNRKIQVVKPFLSLPSRHSLEDHSMNVLNSNYVYRLRWNNRELCNMIEKSIVRKKKKKKDKRDELSRCWVWRQHRLNTLSLSHQTPTTLISSLSLPRVNQYSSKIFYFFFISSSSSFFFSLFFPSLFGERQGVIEHSL